MPETPIENNTLNGATPKETFTEILGKPDGGTEGTMRRSHRLPTITTAGEDQRSMRPNGYNAPGDYELKIGQRTMVVIQSQ